MKERPPQGIVIAHRPDIENWDIGFFVDGDPEKMVFADGDILYTADGQIIEGAEQIKLGVFRIVR